MRHLFLGKPLHWILLIVLVALGWIAGLERLHVTHFNLFVTALLALSAGILAIILRSSAASERVTRDPIPVPDKD